MDKLQEVKSNLVLTYHSKDNYYGNRVGYDRTDISIHQVASAIAYGQLGFAGHRRYKVTHKGLTVLYKKDQDGKYVIITYYKRKPRNKYKNKSKKLLTY